jgi:hypothetical protein
MINEIIVEVYNIKLEDVSVKIYRVIICYDGHETINKAFAKQSELKAFYEGLAAASSYSLPPLEIPSTETDIDVYQ